MRTRRSASLSSVGMRLSSEGVRPSSVGVRISSVGVRMSSKIGISTDLRKWQAKPTGIGAIAENHSICALLSLNQNICSLKTKFLKMLRCEDEPQVVPPCTLRHE